MNFGSNKRLPSLIIVGVFSQFGLTVENPLGVRVIWLVCAIACLLGFFVFIPYRIGDNKEETAALIERRTLN